MRTAPYVAMIVSDARATIWAFACRRQCLVRAAVGVRHAAKALRAQQERCRRMAWSVRVVSFFEEAETVLDCSFKFIETIAYTSMLSEVMVF
jgi:hypothetical protein